MRARIIETSIRLFDEKGYSATSVNEIVEAMNVTKGTFYYYFNSKQDLLRDIHLHYIDGLISQQKIILADADKDCTDKLYAIIHMLICKIGTERQSARIFFREIRHLDDRQIKEIKAKRNEFRKNLQILIESGASNGEFKPGMRADMLTFGILGITNWSYHWYKPDGSVSEAELARLYTDMILNGMKNPLLITMEENEKNNPNILKLK